MTNLRNLVRENDLFAKLFGEKVTNIAFSPPPPQIKFALNLIKFSHEKVLPKYSNVVSGKSGHREIISKRNFFKTPSKGAFTLLTQIYRVDLFSR